MASQFFDVVQRVYIAYYGRPADYDGMVYWSDKLAQASGDFSAIINAFANSAEAQQLYGNSSVADSVDKIYQQLLGRQAEAEGKNWWVAELQAGHRTLANLALDVLYGAQGDDATTISNRLNVAKQFTDQQHSGALSYAGDDAAKLVRDFLSTVKSDSATLDSAKSTLTNLLNQMDKLSDDWNAQHGGNDGGDTGGGGDNSGIPILDDASQQFLAVISLNNNSGSLSTSALRDAVVAKVGLSNYNEAFDISEYAGASDGVLTTAELGFSQLGDLPATRETIESLYYGTIIKALKSIDMQEITDLQQFVLAHQAQIANGDSATIKAYTDLMVEVFADEANPPLMNDQMISQAIVASTQAFVEIVNTGTYSGSIFSDFSLF